MIERIAIIGSGLVGIRAAQTLRSDGFSGQVFLIGDELHPPYDRPSLSKEVLAGTNDLPPPLFEAGWLDDQGIEWLSGETATQLDSLSRRLQLKSGRMLSADSILLATGARARVLPVPGGGLDGIFTLRSLDDCRTLQRELRPGRSLAVVGGGLIGCEVATTARAAGLDVTIIEAGGELMQRVLDPVTAKWCRVALERDGTKVLLNAGVRAFEGKEHVRSVLCTDGRWVTADLVLISIGAEPRTELASIAGLSHDRGILVDATGATGHPHIFAAGDAASWPLVGGGRRSLETYLNSQAQAAVAARAMLGKRSPTPQTPLSWTRIAGQHLQIAGDLPGIGRMIVRGDPAAGSFLAFRLHDDRVVACVSANAPKDFAIARRLVEARGYADAALLADTGINLRDLLRAKNYEKSDAAIAG